MSEKLARARCKWCSVCLPEVLLLLPWQHQQNVIYLLLLHGACMLHLLL